jgi:hypothetical protein
LQIEGNQYVTVNATALGLVIMDNIAVWEEDIQMLRFAVSTSSCMAEEGGGGQFVVFNQTPQGQWYFSVPGLWFDLFYFKQ